MTASGSPRKAKPTESDPLRKDKVRATVFVVMYLLVTVLALGLPGALRASRTKSITYSDFLQLLRRNEVTEVVVAENRIRGTVKNSPELFEAVRVEDPHLLEELERHGVKFAGDIDGTSWWHNLFDWLLPIVLMIAVWNVMLRRMSPRQGAMAFGRSPAKISIVQRGYEALGHTLQLPVEEHYLVTRHALLNQLAVLLGGRSAEEIVFQEVSTGAQNDLQRATELARAMVAEYGMSDALGPVAFKDRGRGRFLEGPSGDSKPFAEDTARLIDGEIKQLMVDAHIRASDILRERRSVLNTLARRLMEQEVVDGADVRASVDQSASSAPQAA